MSQYDEFKEIVIRRLEAMSPDIRVSMGSLGTFSKEELIQNVRADNDLGRFIVEMQIKYLKSMSKGFS